MPRYLLLLALTSLSTASELPDPEPGTLEGVVTSVVASLLEHQHLDGSRLDDEVSSHWFDAYLDALDGNRMFFLQSDIDRFEQWRNALDDNLHRARAKDLEPAFEINRVYVQRVRERAAKAVELAAEDFDFTKDETVDLDRRDAPWFTSPEEQDDYWRRYVKESRLIGELQGIDRETRIEQLEKRYESMAKGAAERESMDILEDYLSALTTVHDPHSTYFKPATSDNFEIDLSNSVEGIGAVLRREDPYTKIVSLVPGGPAEKTEQLQPDDQIIAVAQGDEEPVDISDFKIDKVVKLIRGKKGTEVRLTVIPTGAPADVTKVVTIKRDRVQLKDALAKTEIKEVPGRGKVAVVDVPQFYAPMGRNGGVSRVSADVEEELKDLDKDVDAVVIDLRMNTGGSLAEAIDLTGLFIDRGPVVQVKGRREQVDVYQDRDSGVVWDGPLVVLIDPNSASASEIFAAAIQDYGRGLIVGAKRTHGKGTVQTLVGLERLLAGMVPEVAETGAGTLKLTQQQFYRVSGTSTQGRGVESDVWIPTLYEGIHRYENDYPYAVASDRIDPAPIHRAGDLSDVIPELRKREDARLQGDDAVAKVRKANAWQVEQEELGGVVSLNIDKRKAEREELATLLGEKLVHDTDEPPTDEGNEPEKEEEVDESVVNPDDTNLVHTVQIALDLADLTG